MKTANFLPRVKVVRGLYLLLGAKFFLLVVGSFFPFSHPHIHRQLDTMGVSLRYWIRWTIENNPMAPLLPAVLNRGDFYSITPMEFSLLNLLTAPFFAFDIGTGRVLARVFTLVLLFGLTLLNARIWKGKKIGGIDAYLAALLLPIFSVALRYVGKFMPDYLAFILVMMALGISWEKPRYFWSVLLGALGVLVKPTAIIAFGPLLLKNKKILLKDILFWVFPVAMIGGAYYTVGMDFIRGFEDGPGHFHVHFAPPLKSVGLFLGEPGKLLKLLSSTLFLPGGFFLLVIGTLIGWKRGNSIGTNLILLWGILGLQILTIAALGGPTTFVHDYYFLSVGFVCSLILVGTLEATSLRWLSLLFVLLVLGRGLEISFYEVQRAWGTDPQSTFFKECAELRKKNPQIPWGKGIVFKTSPEEFPALGICFGEMVGASRAPYGFFYKDQGVPQDCNSIDTSSNIILGNCNN